MTIKNILNEIASVFNIDQWSEVSDTQIGFQNVVADKLHSRNLITLKIDIKSPLKVFYSKTKVTSELYRMLLPENNEPQSLYILQYPDGVKFNSDTEWVINKMGFICPKGENGDNDELYKFPPGTYTIGVPNLEKVTIWDCMFTDNSELYKVYADTSNVISIHKIFKGCDNLQVIPKFNRDNIFDDWEAIDSTSLNLSALYE